MITDGNKLPHHDDEVFELHGNDLNKIIVLIDNFLQIKPNLNERVMPYLAYLCDLKPIKKSLDEIAWENGMSLPSWENE